MMRALRAVWFVVRVIASVYWLWMAAVSWGIMDGPEHGAVGVGLACIAVTLFLWTSDSVSSSGSRQR